MNFSDAAAINAAVGVRLEQIGLSLGELAWPAARGAMPVNLSLKMGALQLRSLKGGGNLDKSAAAVDNRTLASMQWQGQVHLAPLGVNGRLRLDRLPLHLGNAYLDPAWGLHLQRLEMGLRSQFDLSLAPEGLQAQASGDVLLAQLQLQQARRVGGQQQLGEDLLDWQALKLNGFKLGVHPGQVPQLSVAEASLSDFYARIIINEAGQINLRELGAAEPDNKALAGKASAPAVQAAQAAAPASVSAAGVGPEPGSVSTAAPPLALSIGQFLLEKGRVDFTDRFVRPNYSARLTELQGSLGAVSSSKTELAPLSLQGRVAGTGLLDIQGQVNPLGKPLMLDLTASATDIELAPLSTYAAKYVGYALERGKFSSKVRYKIEPNGSLSANNQIILNQLTFGEKVNSPDATQLPVLFAVALLKDRNGVIDVDLPITGSINEPQFSLGGLIWKVIINLFGKALSSPFSLLSGGDSADLSRLEFAPGSAKAVAPEALDKVAKMLAERPGLALTITPWADAAAERGALQQRLLDEALLAERRRELQRQRTTATFASTQEESKELTVFSEAESARLLKALYENTKLPNKPRNVLGFAKDIPSAEMRRLLLDSFAVPEERVRQLALERGVVVRDALIAKGLKNDRLFLGAPHLARVQAERPQPEQSQPGGAGNGSSSAAESSAGAAGWTPYAELKLSSH
ncbi:DUF748 domain-containing protein [Paucibacter sp. AS339]|uniref:DUF748 domain-containing protein n=1 Tax=Paucibacter hankyongi TaxID=3133434 RepID=UPI0030B4ACC3